MREQRICALARDGQIAFGIFRCFTFISLIILMRLISRRGLPEILPQARGVGESASYRPGEGLGFERTTIGSALR